MGGSFQLRYSLRLSCSLFLLPLSLALASLSWFLRKRSTPSSAAFFLKRRSWFRLEAKWARVRLSSVSSVWTGESVLFWESSLSSGLLFLLTTILTSLDLDCPFSPLGSFSRREWGPQLSLIQSRGSLVLRTPDAWFHDWRHTEWSTVLLPHPSIPFDKTISADFVGKRNGEWGERVSEGRDAVSPTQKDWVCLFSENPSERKSSESQSLSAQRTARSPFLSWLIPPECWGLWVQEQEQRKFLSSNAWPRTCLRDWSEHSLPRLHLGSQQEQGRTQTGSEGEIPSHSGDTQRSQRRGGNSQCLLLWVEPPQSRLFTAVPSLLLWEGQWVSPPRWESQTSIIPLSVVRTRMSL